jgi:hypothetical protein
MISHTRTACVVLGMLNATARACAASWQPCARSA